MTNRRAQILDAFRKRLRHYGYDKTTMAEIAADAGISVGTLYLEFGGKEDILAALAEETAREFEEVFRSIIQSDRSAPQKLKAVLEARVALSDRYCREGAHSGEVLLSHADRCARMKSAKEAKYLALLERILTVGVEAGELEVADPPTTARILRDAISAYLPPQSLPKPSEEVLARASELIDLLIRGLQPQLQRA